MALASPSLTSVSSSAQPPLLCFMLSSRVRWSRLRRCAWPLASMSERAICVTASSAERCSLRSLRSSSWSSSAAPPIATSTSARPQSAAQRPSKMFQLRALASMSKFRKNSTRLCGVFSNQLTISRRTRIWWSVDTIMEPAGTRSVGSSSASAMTAISSRMCRRKRSHSADVRVRMACSTRTSHMQYTAFCSTTVLTSRRTR
mmetsp:Transcript_16401/g.50186  ORF Transcript_16401/g.50186 Transcript_16401/m.50186 type:complete len:202 (-) Transcript_16401:2614-3219(-)